MYLKIGTQLELNPIYSPSPLVWTLTHLITLIQVSDSCSCPGQGTEFKIQSEQSLGVILILASLQAVW